VWALPIVFLPQPSIITGFDCLDCTKICKTSAILTDETIGKNIAFPGADALNSECQFQSGWIRNDALI
jgi:hypothetical protein